ncbi:MAG: hypothetical protein ABIH69_05720 [bacterium]|nr:hypothetical protein [Candidatus Margulisiibacteriota bacterium]
MKKVILPGLVAGFLMSVVGMAVSMLMGKAIPTLMAEYKNVAMFRPWEDPLMMLFFAHPFVLGLALAYVWDKIKGSLSGNKAVSFAFGVFLVATIPGMFITYCSFQVSLAMTLSWTVTGLVNALVAGLVLSKMNG